MKQHNYAVGDRIRTTVRDEQFNDFDKGDTATITQTMKGATSCLVKWDNRRYVDDVNEDARLDLLHFYQFELVMPGDTKNEQRS